MPEPRAVLFDLDGVLVDSYEAWFKLVNMTARHFRKSDITRERFHECWGQGIDADLREFFPGCTGEDVERFYENHLLDYDSDIQVNPDAIVTLQKLRDARIARAVVTNTPTLLARDILASTGLIGLVDVTVGAAPDRAPKPAPDMMLDACRELELEPAAAIAVGDSRFDAQAAHAARVRFVGFRTGDRESITALPDLLARVLSKHGS